MLLLLLRYRVYGLNIILGGVFAVLFGNGRPGGMNHRLQTAQTLLRLFLWPRASRSQVTSRRKTDAEVREFNIYLFNFFLLHYTAGWNFTLIACYDESGANL